MTSLYGMKSRYFQTCSISKQQKQIVFSRHLNGGPIYERLPDRQFFRSILAKSLIRIENKRPDLSYIKQLLYLFMTYILLHIIGIIHYN